MAKFSLKAVIGVGATLLAVSGCASGHTDMRSPATERPAMWPDNIGDCARDNYRQVSVDPRFIDPRTNYYPVASLLQLNDPRCRGRTVNRVYAWVQSSGAVNLSVIQNGQMLPDLQPEGGIFPISYGALGGRLGIEFHGLQTQLRDPVGFNIVKIGVDLGGSFVPPPPPPPPPPPRRRVNCQNNDQGKLTVRGHSSGSKMLSCPGGQVRNSQSYTGTSAPCDWELGDTWAKLTCRNDGNNSLDADHTYIECCELR